MHNHAAKTLLLLVSLLPFYANSQSDTTFLNGPYISTRQFATAYRLTPAKEGDKYKIVDYALTTNNVLLEAFSLSPDSVIFDGYYTEYYLNGGKREYGNYIKGNRVGAWKLKYEDTDRVWAVMNYFPDKTDTTVQLTSFYKSGKVKRKQWTIHGRDTGECFTETGEIMKFTAFAMLPRFNGDINRFLSKNMHYPDEAREKRIDGKVLVDFYVNTDGSIETIKTMGPDVSLCKEAIRVLKLMPKWKPATLDDVPVKTLYTQPVTFKIE